MIKPVLTREWLHGAVLPPRSLCLFGRVLVGLPVATMTSRSFLSLCRVPVKPFGMRRSGGRVLEARAVARVLIT